MRKIPSSMATQHPDSASRFIPIKDEPEEAVITLEGADKGIGCEEFQIDYMGKMTPYHQIGILIKKLSTESNLRPSEDVFITPRMVSDFYDEPFRQLITILAVMEGIYQSQNYHNRQGITEIIQAATMNVNELVNCYNRANQFFPLLQQELNLRTEESRLRLIPLFEGIVELFNIQTTIIKYIEKIAEKDYLRVFIGKSETAISAGHPSSVLACKLAITDCAEAQEEAGVEIYPILGGGALPFRGGISPSNVENFTREYSGTRTYTIQSAVRYDHDRQKVIEMVNVLKQKAHYKPISYSSDEREKIIDMMAIFSKNYLLELYEILDYVTEAAFYVPNQRERILEISEVSYYRSIRNIGAMFKAYQNKKVAKEISHLALERFGTLPRAIKLSASLYSLGLPPELLGVGNSIIEIREELGQQWIDQLFDYICPSLEYDIKFSSRFYHQSKIETKRISNGLKALRSIVPFDPLEEVHESLSKTALSIIVGSESATTTAQRDLNVKMVGDKFSEYLVGSAEENLPKLILDMGKIRKSLG